jgi:hypothetical protein
VVGSSPPPKSVALAWTIFVFAKDLSIGFDVALVVVVASPSILVPLMRGMVLMISSPSLTIPGSLEDV